MATYLGSEADETGLFALNKVDLFNLVCIPPDTREGDTPPVVYSAALALCAQRRAMLIIDPPAAWKSWNDDGTHAGQVRAALGVTSERAPNAALYFPCLQQAYGTQGGQVNTFAPSGAIAGVMARTDAARGVWKPPAGVDASIRDAPGLSVQLTDTQCGLLNCLGVNCLRDFRGRASLVWGARTLGGADDQASEYRYVPVRRTALHLEESLARGLRWVASEPNDEQLWAQIRLSVDAFMMKLFRQGAFQGIAPHQAYLVRCDRETTTRSDVARGVVQLVVGFAPLRPAEFVIFQLELKARQNVS